MDLEILKQLLTWLSFNPSAQQWDILLDPHRFKLATGGVRAGKSQLSGLYMALQVIRTYYDDTARPGDVYWFIGPSYDLCRKEFQYCGAFLAKLGLLRFQSKVVNPGRIILAGCPECNIEGCTHEPIVIETKSAVDYKTLAADAPKGIVVCEAGHLDIESFWRVEERSAQERAWVLLSGVFEGSLGWYPEKFTSWQAAAIQVEQDARSFNLPSYSNLAIFPGGRSDPEILRMERDHSPEWFAERVEGVPAPPRGRVFDEFRIETHVTDNSIEPGLPIHLWIDPGYSRATDSAYAVECFQVVEGQVRGVDEIFEQELTGPEICTLVMQRPWWGTHEKFGVIDVAGLQHQAMPSQVEVWLEYTGLYLASKRVEINDGTERMKTFLKPDPITGEPGIIFDKSQVGLISEYGGWPNPFTGQAQVYQWKTDQSGNVIGNRPWDRYNHGIKATIYGLINQFGFARSTEGKERKAAVSYW